MNASYFRHLAMSAMSMGGKGGPRFPPSPYYRFLYLLAQNVKPSLSVELGVCGGGASYHLAVGHPGGAVVGVEHAVGSAFEKENWTFIAASCPNWTLWKGDSVDDAGAIAAKHGKASILFIDTIHTFERTVQEFMAWEPHLSDRAVVCLDDLNRREMAGLWDWVPWQNKLRLDLLHDGGLDKHGYGDGGFGVVWGW